MTFGEKLLKLRKGKGISQEALAEQLNTSRQAISKWENGQGYPETERLLIISSIFNVSIDYLLKDSVERNLEDETGYYASREMIEGFLINERKISKYTSFGISLILSSFIPYMIFQKSFIIYSIIITIMVTLGVGTLIATIFMEDKYEVLKREPLIFDEKFLSELRSKYTLLRKKYISLTITGICFIIAGGTILLLFKKGLGSGVNSTPYYIISTLFIVIGIYILINSTSMMEAYEILVKNHEYINKLSSKLLKKLKNTLGML